MSEDIYAALAGKFPGLVVKSTPPNLRLFGDFELTHNGVLFDAYRVDIRASGFPNAEPKVFELDGRVKAGEHRNPDNSCCTGVFEVWRAEHPTGSIVAFLEGPVRNYFLGHRQFEITGHWPFGERSHGAKGVVEAAADFLGVKADKGVVIRYLRALARMSYDGHQHCPCGSHRPVRLCHGPALVKLRRRVKKEDAVRILQKLKAQDLTVQHERRWQRPEIVSRLRRRYLR